MKDECMTNENMEINKTKHRNSATVGGGKLPQPAYSLLFAALIIMTNV